MVELSEQLWDCPVKVLGPDVVSKWGSLASLVQIGPLHLPVWQADCAGRPLDHNFMHEL